MPAINVPSLSVAKIIPASNQHLAAVEGKKVLILEDEATLLQMYEQVLINAGYDVFGVSSVAQAISALENQSFDIMLSDAGLPDGDPRIAISKFRVSGNEPVIICSGHVESSTLIRRLGENEYRFLQKPFPLKALLDLLYEVSLTSQTELDE